MENVRNKYVGMVQMLDSLKRALAAYDKRNFFTSPLGYEDDLVVGF